MKGLQHLRVVVPGIYFKIFTDEQFRLLIKAREKNQSVALAALYLVKLNTGYHNTSCCPCTIDLILIKSVVRRA